MQLNVKWTFSHMLFRFHDRPKTVNRLLAHIQIVCLPVVNVLEQITHMGNAAMQEKVQQAHMMFTVHALVQVSCMHGTQCSFRHSIGICTSEHLSSCKLALSISTAACKRIDK